MTVKLSTATRNGLLGTQGLTTQFLRGAIRVYSGPQPLNAHAKFLLMWPGLDRCATIGFRCVKDATS